MPYLEGGHPNCWFGILNDFLILLLIREEYFIMSKKIYNYVTERIIKKIEDGTVPWHKPWKSFGFPRNFISKKPYSGVNAFMLGMSDFENPYWATYSQIVSKGGTVKKGEKASMIIFWKMLENKGYVKGEGMSKNIPLLRYFNVFNLEQTEGLEKYIEKQEVEQIEFNPIDACENVVKNFLGKPIVVHGGDKACYSPMIDNIRMPKKESFYSVEEYYSTLFHEFAHSTGHKKRLDRSEVMDFHGFGSHDYSKEELVAEMSASFLACITGIDVKVIDNSASYISSWLSKIKKDPKLIIHAAAQAQKAVEYMKNHPKKQKKDESKLALEAS